MVGSLSINGESSICVDEKKTYTVSTIPETVSYPTAAWTSSNTAVTSADADTGAVTGISVEQTTITVTVDGMQASLNLTVNKGSQTIAAPTASEISANTVTLNAIAAGKGDTKYAINTSNSVPDSDWQDSTVFTGLTCGTYKGDAAAGKTYYWY